MQMILNIFFWRVTTSWTYSSYNSLLLRQWVWRTPPRVEPGDSLPGILLTQAPPWRFYICKIHLTTKIPNCSIISSQGEDPVFAGFGGTNEGRCLKF